MTSSSCRRTSRLAPSLGPGERIQSFHEDYKINLKAGYDPAPGQDYSVNFIDQVGEKGNPPPDGIIPPAELA